MSISVYTKQPQKLFLFIKIKLTTFFFLSHTQKEYLIRLACYKEERIERATKRKCEKKSF